VKIDKLTDKQVDNAIAQSANTFQDWKTSYPESGCLKQSSLMREKTALSTLITLEMGKILSQAEGEVELSADILDYYAKNGEVFLQIKN
jgi:succinate-semialdehyde dehydrogenase/glutarate-semialdehyde dehydrogenase